MRFTKISCALIFDPIRRTRISKKSTSNLLLLWMIYIFDQFYILMCRVCTVQYIHVQYNYNYNYNEKSLMSLFFLDRGAKSCITLLYVALRYVLEITSTIDISSGYLSKSQHAKSFIHSFIPSYLELPRGIQVSISKEYTMPPNSKYLLTYHSLMA